MCFCTKIVLNFCVSRPALVVGRVRAGRSGLKGVTTTTRRLQVSQAAPIKSPSVREAYSLPRPVGLRVCPRDANFHLRQTLYLTAESGKPLPMRPKLS